MATKTYTVKTPVNHDGEHYARGDTIKLENKHAEPLLAVGAIGAVEPAAKEPAADRGDKGGRAGAEKKDGLPLGDGGN